MPPSNREEIHQLIHDLRNRLNNIAVNGELARLLLEKGNAEPEVTAKLDKIVGDTRDTAKMLQRWFEQTSIE